MLMTAGFELYRERGMAQAWGVRGAHAPPGAMGAGTGAD